MNLTIQLLDDQNPEPFLCQKKTDTAKKRKLELQKRVKYPRK